VSEIAQIKDRILAGCNELGVTPSGTALERLAEYSRLIFQWRRIVNLTAAPTTVEFAERHIVDCLAACRFIRGDRVLDIGSGAGLPGVVLAIMKPELDIVLLDSRQRRARFLTQARIELALENVEVVCRRIQQYAPERRFGSIICRAYGPLERFLADTRALHHRGCRLIALKGRDPRPEVAALGDAAGACDIHRVSVPSWAERHIVLVDCGRLPGLPIARDVGGAD
jgi:16S rRNA (guanine527-N7)-methyltransferase